MASLTERRNASVGDGESLADVAYAGSKGNEGTSKDSQGPRWASEDHGQEKK